MRYTRGLEWVKQRFDQVPVDKTRIRPIVKITGEFWAQTTEGDGNFSMFPFLEREGRTGAGRADRHLDYMIHQAKQKIRDRRGLKGKAKSSPGVGAPRPLRAGDSFRSKIAKLGSPRRCSSASTTACAASSASSATVSDQYELQRIGHPFYNSAHRRRRGAPRGGEEHLLHEQEPCAHGAVGEAVRLHALDPVGRRAGGGRASTRT
jgi:hypothetical protein